ncbi:MAG TPA: hypothetical protein VF142_06780, partial [Longimicrobium sp.]
MYTVQYGGKEGAALALETSDSHVVVRTRSRAPLPHFRAPAAAPVAREARAILANFEVQTRFAQAGVEVLQMREGRSDRALRDDARAVLREQPDVCFAGRTLVTPAVRPVVYTENFFVKFDEDEDRRDCEALIARYGLTVKRPLAYARNAFFVGAPEGTGLDVFDIAARLLEEPAVQLCHPELVREVRERAVFPQQWHLKRAVLGGGVV